MKTAKFKYLTVAAIVIFLMAGTAWADGKRGRDHNSGGQGYHQGYRHHGPDYRRPAPHRNHPSHGPKYHHGPRYYAGPKQHHGYAYPHHGYRHHRQLAYVGYAPYPGSGLHVSVFDPYFAFGFSTGGHW